MLVVAQYLLGSKTETHELEFPEIWLARYANDDGIIRIPPHPADEPEFIVPVDQKEPLSVVRAEIREAVIMYRHVDLGAPKPLLYGPENIKKQAW